MVGLLFLVKVSDFYNIFFYLCRSKNEYFSEDVENNVEIVVFK